MRLSVPLSFQTQPQKEKMRINNNPLLLTPIVDISSDNIDYGITSHVV